MIMKCLCSHEQQDQMYGKGMRIFNACAGKTNVKYRCTVCKHEKELDQTSKEKGKK